MLQSFRDNLKGVTATIIIGLLIIPFAFFGVESIFVSGSAVDEAARVNGDKITQLELERGVEFQKQRLLAQFQDMDPAALDDTRIRGPVLDQLVRQRLVIQAAADNGMAVTDQTFNEIILKDESFQEGGKFDRGIYEYKLSRLGYTPLSYREAVKSELLASQLSAGLQFTAIVPQREVDQFSHLALQQRSFQYLTLGSSDLQHVQVGEEEIAEYYEQHQRDFEEPEKVIVDYIELSPAILQAGVDVTDKQIDERLASLAEGEAGQGKAWTIAHILIEAGDEQAARLSSVREKLAAGEDFAVVAKAYSADFGSAEGGGELGRFTQDALPPGFAEVVADMKAGDVSAPVVLDSGTHIIKVLEVADGSDADPQGDRDAAIAQLKAELAQEKLPAMLERLKEESFSADSLAVAAEALALPLQTSEPFSAAGGTGVAQYPAVVEAAFDDEVLEEGFASEVLELGDDRFVVIKLKEHIAARVQPLSEVSAGIAERLKVRKAQAEAKTQGAALLAELATGKNLEELAESKGLTVSVESGVTRFDQRLSPELLGSVFKVNVSASLPAADMLAVSGGDVVVYAVTEIKPGKADMLSAEDRQAMWASLGQISATEEYLAYLDALEAGAEIRRSEGVAASR